MMQVNEIFRSISGEVGIIPQGTITTFVRFQGCNLNCAWCFGVKSGRRIPRIVLAKNPNKQLPKVVVGDDLMTFDSHGNLVQTTVINVTTREVDNWYEIKIEDHLYFVTGEHPFFTTKGLIKACDLCVGNVILHGTPQNKISFSKRGFRNPMKDPEVARKSANNTDYAQMGISLSLTIQQKKKQGIYKDTWSLMLPETRRRTKELISKSKKGQKNPNWGKSINKKNCTVLKQEVRQGLHVCELCSSIKNLNVHHKNGNPKDDALSNLQILCHSCHGKVHEVGFNFWNGNRKDGKELLQVQNGFRVQQIKQINRYDISPSIRPPKLKVYNLSCFPYNSYLIDYMWVHNCDTPHVQSLGNGKEMSVFAITQKIPQYENVVLTGGEPLLQSVVELRELVHHLKYEKDCILQIETNGSQICPLDIPLVLDYKTPSSEMDKFMINDTKFVQSPRNSWIKFVLKTNDDLKFALAKIRKLEILRSNWLRYALSVESGEQVKQAITTFEINFPAIIHKITFNVQLHKFLKLS